MSDQRFSQIVDQVNRQNRQGESDRQAKGGRSGYGHKSSVRKRAASRLAR